MSLNETELKAAVEAIIYAADEPVSAEQIARTVEADRPTVRNVIAQLAAESQSDARGVEIREVAGGFKVFTKPHLHDVVRKYIKSLQPPLRLSMPALETLAVIAYRQPVTLPEINEIRGVNCSGVIETLLDRRLITTAGRKQVIGRPILYRTTKDFLMRFGLADVSDLPSLKEFEELARQALGADAGLAPEESAQPGDEPHPLVDRGAPEESAQRSEPSTAAGESAS